LERVFGPEMRESLQGCIDRRLLLRDRFHLRYRHELARRVGEQSRAEARRRSLHAQVWRCLETREPSAAALPQLVHHADAADDGDAVMRHAPLAGDGAARQGAPRQAAAFYRVALRRAELLSGGQRAAILDKLAWELMSSGAMSE